MAFGLVVLAVSGLLAAAVIHSVRDDPGPRAIAWVAGAGGLLAWMMAVVVLEGLSWPWPWPWPWPAAIAAVAGAAAACGLVGHLLGRLLARPPRQGLVLGMLRGPFGLGISCGSWSPPRWPTSTGRVC